MRGDSSGNGRVLEQACSGAAHARHDRPLRDPRGDQHGRYAHAQAIEQEWLAGAGIRRLCHKAVGYALRRWNVIVDAAVLVVGDQQRGGLPERRIVLDRLIYSGNEALTFAYIVVGMLVGAKHSPIVALVIAVIRLDE